MIVPKRLGHVVFRVHDIARSKDFYTRLLGFHVVEEDPDHGGVFMGLGEDIHTLDLIPSTASASGGPHREFRSFDGLGVHHVAFAVDSHDALAAAYFELADNHVPILAAMDHVSQESIYFSDPDGNILELYWERPDARAIFARGRGDQDATLVFTRG
jgi:catechol 2,3-dioxygenase